MVIKFKNLHALQFTKILKLYVCAYPEMSQS